MLKSRLLLYCYILLIAGLLAGCSISKPANTGVGQPSSELSLADIPSRLKTIPGLVSVKLLETDNLFSKNYELWFEQPIDHREPQGPVFRQRVLLGHLSFKAPCIVEIQGYGIQTDKAGELATLLQANQVRIEHRFFDPSKPDSISWEKLTVWQAATDQHQIIQKLKKALYPDTRFISTGISKGGQCTMIHRSIYPDDVVASVAYVAPLNFKREDPRIYDFLKTVGTPAQRDRIYQFQKLCFERKEGMLQKMTELQAENNYTWNMDLATALDYYILEYSFAFWQWGAVEFADIPTEEASDETLLKHVLEVSGLYFFEESDVNRLRPFFWAALTEIGMYGYETEAFQEYLGTTEPYLFDFAAPAHTQPQFQPQAMQSVQNYIQNEATRMLFIYGGLDTWGATGVVLSEAAEKRDNHVMTLADGHHGTRIASFNGTDKQKIYEILERWSGREIGMD